MNILDKMGNSVVRFNNWMVECVERLDRWREGLIAKFEQKPDDNICGFKNKPEQFRDLSRLAMTGLPMVRFTNNLDKYIDSHGKRVRGTNILFHVSMAIWSEKDNAWLLEMGFSAMSEAFFCCYNQTDIFDYSAEI